jgi:peptide chain release factor 1
MFERLGDVESRYEDMEAQLADPELLANHEAYTRVNRELAGMREIVEGYRRWRSINNDILVAKDMLRDPDPDMRDMARMELDDLEEQLPEVEQQLKLLMLPRDPMDERNIVLEIRAGTGGDESSLFCGNLFEMYTRFAQERRWKLEILSASEGTVGGYKEIVAMISGDRVYSTLKWESGVHRVQRVPATESQGRIHTSACTVAILPEAEDVEIDIQLNDLRIDTYRASGAGGQHVNRTDSAIRITHMPTGIVVTCQDEKSQLKNKDKAMKVLRTRLFEAEREKVASERADERRGQVGSDDRSERIRTYNYPQNRVTDHRINLTLYALDRFVMGEMDEMIDAMHAAHQAEMLRAAEDNAL